MEGRPGYSESFMTASALLMKARRALWVCAAVAILLPGTLSTLLAVLLFHHWWQLVAFFWIFIPGSLLIQEPAVIYAATNYHPGLVAGVAGLSVMIGTILDYAILTKIFKLRGVTRVKQTALYQKAVRWFYWRPWQTIVLFAFSPLPYLPIHPTAAPLHPNR